MPRITVRSDDREQTMLLSELVLPCHINDEHYAVQFLERLAWAVTSGAEAEERRRAERRGRIEGTPLAQPLRRRGPAALPPVQAPTPGVALS